MIDDKSSSADFVADESPHFSEKQPQQEFAAWEEVVRRINEAVARKPHWMPADGPMTIMQH